ncbi:MAG: C/D box methylation guide ribonucleoprotein complex aNOP56 subunit [Thermoprotei archaeon]|nr:MAG: C/D box methylation guide ribonucleoprotein complex aNOP56 subunit [Thermoprotei archaeon]RLE98371.1 MAG: C/D box methylation guide ribonucleoprotein complex aNOP56 subunit [Thermoprotei archaeon]
MRGYLACSPAALLILDEKGDIIAAKKWPEDPERAAEELMGLEEGRIPQTLLSLIGEVTELDSLVVEDADLGKSLAQVFKGEVIVKPNNDVVKAFRERLLEYLEKLGVSEEEYRRLLYELSLHLTRRKVRKAAEKRDLFVAQAISALDDVNKTLNLFASRIREWYSLHFPEMDDLVDEHEDYIQIVSKIGHRSKMSVDALVSLGINEKLARRIVEAAKTSMGADMAEFDLNAIKLLSDIALQLYEVRRGLEKYIDEAMMEVAPNVRGLVGPLLGARLIALAGGLSKLATLPASTIQVLGAEKALFRALRTGSKPPKHGVIFQYPAIHRSPRWQRGKIARALAAKLAIAARIDAFTGEYKADELKAQLEQRIKEIKTLYAKPPKRPSPPPGRRRGRRRRRR